MGNTLEQDIVDKTADYLHQKVISFTGFLTIKHLAMMDNTSLMQFFYNQTICSMNRSLLQDLAHLY